MIRGLAGRRVDKMGDKNGETRVAGLDDVRMLRRSIQSGDLGEKAMQVGAYDLSAPNGCMA